MNAVHGGDLMTVAAASGKSIDDLIDFSANINPLGPPDGVAEVLYGLARDPSALSRYPDPFHRALREAFAEHAGTAPENVAVGNGSAALIDATIRALRPVRALLPVPAFSEYRKALAMNGVEVVPLRLDPNGGFRLDAQGLQTAARDGACDLCLFANPQNPSGAFVQRSEIREIVKCLGRVQCRTILDEAFIDYLDRDDASLCGLEQAAVLRSVTKFYGIPGVRVGFALAEPALARSIEAMLPSWPIGAGETAIVRAALKDHEYARRSIDCNNEARNRLSAGLEDLGCRVFPSRANFVLADVAALCDDARVLCRSLIEMFGIVLRDCSDFDVLKEGRFVRIAVRSSSDNVRLLDALRKVAR